MFEELKNIERIWMNEGIPFFFSGKAVKKRMVRRDKSTRSRLVQTGVVQ